MECNAVGAKENPPAVGQGSKVSARYMIGSPESKKSGLVLTSGPSIRNIKPNRQARESETSKASSVSRLAGAALGLGQTTSFKDLAEKPLTSNGPCMDVVELLDAHSSSSFSRKSLNAGADDVHESGLNMCQKFYPAIASWGDILLISFFNNARFVYTSIFKADPTLLGIFGIISVAYDALNGPAIGQFSDKGYFNILWFRNLHAWGRRAPMGWISLFVLAVGGFLMYNGPLLIDSPAGRSVWWAVTWMLFKTGQTMYRTASAASRNEIFVTQDERVFVLMAIAGFDAFGYLMGGGFLASVVIRTEGLSLSEIKLLYLVVGIAIVAFNLIKLPWVSAMAKTKMKTDTAEQPAIWNVLINIMRTNKHFWYLLAYQFFWGSGFATLMNMVTYYFKYVLNQPNDKAANLQMCITAPLVLSMVPSAILCGRLLKKVDPIKLITLSTAGFGLILGGTFLLAFFIESGGGEFVLLMIVYASGGLLLGIPGGLIQVTVVLVLAWTADDDQVHQAEAMGVLDNENSEVEGDVLLPPRRDGILLATKDVFLIAGDVFANLFMVILGALGYDGALDTDIGHNQPHQVVMVVKLIFWVFIPVFFILSAVFASVLPFRGQYLQTLKIKYEQLHEMQVRALENLPRASLTTTDSNTGPPNTSCKAEVV